MQPVHAETFELIHDDEGLLETEDLAVELLSEQFGITGWNPFVPSPSPLTVNRLAGRIIPRAPVRLNQPQGQAGGGGGNPPKQDPRMTRFTEAVSMVINGLIDSGAVYRSGVNSFNISYVIREVAGTAAFNGEVFYNTSTGFVSWKDSNGVVFAFSGGGSGSGSIDGGGP